MPKNDDLKIKLDNDVPIRMMQNRVRSWVERTRGFDDTTTLTALNHILDETKELKYEVRDLERIAKYNPFDAAAAAEAGDKSLEIATELADIFILSCDVCNKMGIDFQVVIAQKFNVVLDRKYTTPDARGVVRHD